MPTRAPVRAHTRAARSPVRRLVATCASCGTPIPPDRVMCTACADA